MVLLEGGNVEISSNMTPVVEKECDCGMVGTNNNILKCLFILDLEKIST